MRIAMTTLCAAMFCTLLATPVSAERVLRVTLQLPINHHLGQNITAFKEQVERETDGEIKIEIYPSAQLYKDNEVPKAVASGAIEMGIASLTRFAGTIPAVDIFYVPFMFPNQDLVAKATAPGSPVRQPLDEAMLATGTRPLWRDAGFNVRSFEDIQQLVWEKFICNVTFSGPCTVFGKTVGEFVSAVGGAPALMSGSQQFLAYQRGTVDVGMTGLTAIPSRKLYQVMDHVSITNHADIEFVVLINEKVWQSLSDEHREIMTRAGRRVEQELREKIARVEQESLAFAREKMTVVEINEDDLAAWREATSAVVDVYIDNAGPLGKQLVDAARGL